VTERWRPGEVISVRHVLGGEVLFAEAVNVVDDRQDRLVVYAPLGAAMQWSALDFDTGVFSPRQPMRRHTTDALRIHYPGEGFAVSAFYHGGGGDFWCWYIDMQEPFRRAGGGIVTMDHMLDIVAGLDLRWRWKDQDHVERSIASGLLTAQQADEIRRAGERVVKRIESHAAPFNEPWPDWRAPKDWPMPELPDDWAAVPA
jgi:hypothetical protein